MVKKLTLCPNVVVVAEMFAPWISAPKAAGVDMHVSNSTSGAWTLLHTTLLFQKEASGGDIKCITGCVMESMPFCKPFGFNLPTTTHQSTIDIL